VSEAAGNLPEAPTERVRAIVERVVAELELDAEVSVEEGDEEIVARVEGEGEELGVLIGRHGQTIDALQLLCYRAAFDGPEGRKRVTVDAAGYRDRRREALEGVADRAAEDALRLGQPVHLEPMSANERRVVHQYLAGRSGIATHSEGEEPERHLVVAPLVGSE